VTTSTSPTAVAPPAAPTKTDKPEKKGPTQNARLSPGGIVDSGSHFPLSLTANFGTALGNGILSAGYSIQPQLSSSLTLRPSWALPKADWMMAAPRISASIDISMPNWLPSSGGSGVYDRQLSVSDFGMSFVLPQAFKEDFTGITVTPVVSVRLPLSLHSRQQNQIANGGVSAQFAWSTAESDLGQISLSYTPSLRGTAYGLDFPTIKCGGAPAEYGTPSAVGDPVNGTADLPLVLARKEEVLPSGECILAGRQSVASFSNSGAVSWGLGDHSVSVSLGWVNAFLRPLSYNPSLSSAFASGQNFVESSSGSISYSYQVPVEGYRLFLDAGIASNQPAYDARGGFRFPFFDFFTPANNFTSAFFDVTVSL
jgi:hypothetical protein